MGHGILLGFWRYSPEDSLGRMATGSVEILQGSGVPRKDMIRATESICQPSGPLTPRMFGCYDPSFHAIDRIPLLGSRIAGRKYLGKNSISVEPGKQSGADGSRNGPGIIGSLGEALA